MSASPARSTATTSSIAIAPAFVRNTGQADPRARFVSVGGGQPIFFTSNDVRIVDTKRQRSLWLTFIDGAARDIDGEWSTGGHVTVLRHATAAAGEPIFRDIVYRGVWRGIDARVGAAAKGLKYSFEVSPGADPRAIHLRYSGHDSIELSDSGELVLDAGGATIIDTKPVAFQHINGRTVNVPVRFVQFDADVAFSVGEYDKSRPLTIDPTLVYSTYLGSSGADFGNAIAVDSSGAAYVAGTSKYTDLPVTSGAFQTTWHGDPNNPSADAFVAKINAAGNHFDYVTYLGGSRSDEAFGIAVDADGNAYVTGYTDSTDFPTTGGTLMPSRAPGRTGRDGFVTKLNSTGTALMYSTYLGTDVYTVPHGIAIDGRRSAYIVGETQSLHLPSTSTAMGPWGNGRLDGFLLTISPAGNFVTFGTYMGGPDDEVAQAVAVDAAGHAYVTGWTRSTVRMTIGQGADGHVLQSAPQEVIFRSDDAGQSFVPVNNYLPSSFTYGVAIDPATPSTAYQASYDMGLLKTVDAGAHWTSVNPYFNAHVDEIAIDPASPNILLAGAGYPWRSTDGGAHWNQTASYQVNRFAFAPSTPSIVYAVGVSAYILKSTDAGATWTAMAPWGTTGPFPVSVAIDPGNPNVVYVGVQSGGVYKTSDGGATWTFTSINPAAGNASAIAIDPTLTSVVWAGFANGSIYKSTNAGASWTPAAATSLASVSRLTFDGGTLYVADSGFQSGISGVQKASLWRTADRGATWTPIKIRGNVSPVYGLAALNGVVYVGGPMHQEAFVWKLDTANSTQPLMAGTYLGGGLNDRGVGVAMDPSGSAVVAVDTDSADFPTTTGTSITHSTLVRFTNDLAQIAASSYVGNSGAVPSFARGVAVDGNYNAYVVSALGAPGGDQGIRVDRVDQAGNSNANYAVDGTQSNVGQSVDLPAGIAAGPLAGEVYVTGSTTSTNFPVTEGAPQQSYGSGTSDAFAFKLSFRDSTPPPPPPPPPDGTNLALNKLVTTSSDFGSQYDGRFAVDGNGSTRWSSQFSDPQWILVDLGQRYNVTDVKLKWEAAYGADFTIQVSDDSLAWTTVATAINNTSLNNDFPVSGTGRYVRMNGTRRATQWGYSLWEFEVYGTTATPPPPTGDLALHKPVVSSSDFSPDYAAAYAVDGNGGTRWSSQFSDPQWIYVDLGQRYDINRVKLVWETAYAADYEIQISNDARHWVRIAGAQNNSLLTARWGAAGMGRYVRIYGTRRGTQWGYSLFSFEVYGNPVTDVDVALHKDVVASSEFSADDHSGFVTDGDPSTRWSSEFSDPQWIYIDLGSIFVINRIKLAWETAYGADYTIELSYDHSSWWNAATITNGTGGVDDLVVGGTARYVRLSGTRRGTEWGYSLWSFEVYGKPGP